MFRSKSINKINIFFLILKKTIFTVGKLPSIHYCQINYLIPSLDNTIDLEIVGFAIYDGMY